MEMYSLTWALAVMYTLCGPLIGLFMPFFAIPEAIFSLFTRKYRRGLTASRFALACAFTPLPFTVVMWYELITGKWINGDPVKPGDEDFALYKFVAIFDAIALAAAIVSWLRQKLRRQEAVAMVSAAPPPTC